jgi:hypothetical protein
MPSDYDWVRIIFLFGFCVSCLIAAATDHRELISISMAVYLSALRICAEIREKK